MEVVRHFLDADRLKGILPLPDSFRNRRVEVIILPAEPEKAEKDGAKVGSALESLLGALPHTDMTLEELREERLRKYEAAD